MSKTTKIADDLARAKAGAILSKPAPSVMGEIFQSTTRANKPNDAYVPPPPKREFVIKREPITWDGVDRKLLEDAPVTSKTTFCEYVLTLGLPWPIYATHDTEIFETIQQTFVKRRALASTD